MPRIVDNVGLPEPILSAISNKVYSKGEGVDYSATELIAPAFQRALMREHEERLEEEASDLIFALIGSSVHTILERAEVDDNDRYLREKRYTAEVAGKIVSGGVDLVDLHDSTLHDFKVCSRWVGVFGAKDEWKQQLNIYRYLLYKNGINVERLKVHAIFRDWEKTKALRGERDYPKKQVQTFEVEAWTIEDTEHFIEGRIHAHLEAERSIQQALSDADLVGKVCSKDERWQKDDSWAVMKRGRKSAMRVLPSRIEADNWLIENANGNSGMYLEPRLSEAKRCTMYCVVKDYCPFGKNIQ